MPTFNLSKSWAFILATLIWTPAMATLPTTDCAGPLVAADGALTTTAPIAAVRQIRLVGRPQNVAAGGMIWLNALSDYSYIMTGLHLFLPRDERQNDLVSRAEDWYPYSLRILRTGEIGLYQPTPRMSVALSPLNARLISTKKLFMIDKKIVILAYSDDPSERLNIMRAIRSGVVRRIYGSPHLDPLDPASIAFAHNGWVEIPPPSGFVEVFQAVIDAASQQYNETVEIQAVGLDDSGHLVFGEEALRRGMEKTADQKVYRTPLDTIPF